MQFSKVKSIPIVTTQFIKVQKHIRAVESPDKSISLAFAAIKRFLPALLAIAQIGQPKRGGFSIEYKLYIRITYSLQEIFLFLSITPLNFQSKEFFVNNAYFRAKIYGVYPNIAVQNCIFSARRSFMLQVCFMFIQFILRIARFGAYIDSERNFLWCFLSKQFIEPIVARKLMLH